MRGWQWPAAAGLVVVLGAGWATGTPVPPAVQERDPLPPRLQTQIDALTPRSQALLWRLSGHCFTWITGSAADEAPGDPGRVANVFGFDRYAIASAGGATPASVARDFFAVLRGPQRSRLLKLVGEEAGAQPALGAKRAELAALLRPALRHEALQESAALEVAAEIGRLEGARALAQAKVFAAVARTLTVGQKQAMKELRDRTLDLGRQPGVTDAQWGQKLFLHCLPCHTREPGRSHFGPPLFGVAGRRAASAGGYTYGEALKAKGAAGLTWTDANLDRYLTAPGDLVPGVRMSFEGLPGAAERKAIVAYLKTLK